MSFTAFDMPQRSPEWYRMRAGLLTGSCVDAVLATRKRGTGELAIRTALRRRLVAERLTGSPIEDISGDLPAHMQRGNDVEPVAFAAYEAATGNIVTRVGFVAHDTLQTGCSPDGYIGQWEGLIELKCPKQVTHLEHMMAGVVPEEYRGQVMHALWLTGAQWCDFCSFDPRFPPSHELFRVRMTRDSFDVAAYELAVRLFLDEVEAEYQTVLSLRTEAA
jgi:hypothetical protein